MRKNRAQFNEEEMEVIDKITTTLMIKLCYCLEYYRDHRQWNKDLSRLLRSDSVLGASVIFFNIKNMDPNKPLPPQLINKEIATKLAEESETYLASDTLSRILKELKQYKILENIRGKQNVKQQISHVIRRSKYSDRHKPQGYYSFYKTTEEVEKYNQVLSNPLVVMHINERLKNSGLLKPAFICIAKSCFHAVKNSDERTEKFFKMIVKSSYTHAELSVRPTDSDWIEYKQALGSLDKKTLNDLTKDFVDYLLENPSGYVFLILSLPKLDLQICF
jgi:hypothetical protein